MTQTKSPNTPFEELEKEWLKWNSAVDYVKWNLHFGFIKNPKMMKHIISTMQKELRYTKKKLAYLIELASNEKEIAKVEILESFKRIKEAIDKSQHYY